MSRLERSEGRRVGSWASERLLSDCQAVRPSDPAYCDGKFKIAASAASRPARKSAKVGGT